jgi:hypothetical protein
VYLKIFNKRFEGDAAIKAYCLIMLAVASPAIAWAAWRGIIGWDILLYPIAGYMIGRASR